MYFVFFLIVEFVGYVILRFLKFMCCIELGWCEEDLLLAIKRVIFIIYFQIVFVNVFGIILLEFLIELMFVLVFVCCFFLLRCVLREGGKVVKGDEDFRQEVFYVVVEYCKL